ncbi:alpha-L-iduronidase [Cloeon dipterum]|uniref:alpha-L-iduronidase n=1 Tax=Cloeon dipterum TaxID=197152 RepID=UPI0032207C64
MTLLCLVLSLATTGIAIKVDFPYSNEIPKYLSHIWTSTGFSPEARNSTNWTWPLDLTRDERLGFALIGSLRGGALTHVRIHWLFDFITYNHDSAEKTFNFSALDSTMSLLHQHNLSPSFELMGNPSGKLLLDDQTDQQPLRSLVLQTISRYQSKFGSDRVQLWRWETWNEPDLRMYWNASLPAYISYLRTVVDALTQVGLKVGGPAGLFRPKHRICWQALDEFARLSQPEKKISFLSFHRKGKNSADEVIAGTQGLIKTIKFRYPNLDSIPMSNDEADPLSGWWRLCDWHADVRYAAMVVRTAIRLLDNVTFLSNDNAFLPHAPHYFTQRTLLARFQQSESSTHFFLKPVAISLVLLSLLGEKLVPFTIKGSDDRLTILSSSSFSDDGAFEGATVISFANETQDCPYEAITVDLALHCEGSRCADDARYALFLLDNIRTNPERVWRDGGSPAVPDAVLRRRMRDAQGPFRVVTSAPITMGLTLTLRVPSVALVQVCSKREAVPGAPTNLTALHPAPGETLLVWSDLEVGTRCLLGYEIYSRNSSDATWTKLTQGSILTQWHHDAIKYEYQVHAVDLWKRHGYKSSIVTQRG